MPNDKIVISTLMGGDVRRVTSRARLLVAAEFLDRASSLDDPELSTTGRDLLAKLSVINGLELRGIKRHAIVFKPIHPALWSWEEIEKDVIGAFRDLLGTELDVLRDESLY